MEWYGNMRIRKKRWAIPELEVCDYFIKDCENYKGKWQTKFKKKQPLQLELGCGKCGFIAELAFQNPDINYLAVDIKSDMLGVGRRNIVKRFENTGRQVDNILLTAKNIEQIDDIISPQDEVQRIYINFCNPWPRKKHKKRRLTYPRLLEKYKQFLVKGGEIRFKTDDDELFAESLEYFEQCGFEMLKCTYDLHNSDITDNIMTEHEKMFSEQGIKIKYCAVRFNGQEE